MPGANPASVREFEPQRRKGREDIEIFASFAPLRFKNPLQKLDQAER